MHKILFAILFFSQSALAQSADFILLKRKDRTVKTFFKGSQIAFQTTGGAYRDAVIKDLRNDSIFLREYIINHVPTTLGFIIMDTVGSYSYAYHYKEIKTFGITYKKFNLTGSGAALFSGGLLLTLASGVSYLGNKKKFSPQLLIAGAGLGTAGYFLSKKGSKGIVVGRRNYSLKYMSVSAR